MKEKNPIKNPAKNSWLRKHNPFHPLAEWLVKNGISANQVTDVGMYSVLAGAALKTIPPELLSQKIISPISLGLIATGESADAVDGLVADISGTSSNQGAIKDFKSDRKQELVMAVSRVITASYRRDIWGITLAMLSGFTSLFPGLYRALLEVLGHHPPESGIGTRFTRAVLGAISTAYPKDPFFEFTIQPFFDTISTITNIITTVERYRLLQNAKKEKLTDQADETAIELGNLKVEELKKIIPLSGLILGICGAFGIINSLRDKKS